MEPRLSTWVEALKATGWASLVLDAHNTLVWISEEFKGFLHEPDDERVGVGKHVAEAMASEVWLRTLTPQSVLELLNRAVPYFIDGMPGGVDAFAERLPEPLGQAIRLLKPAPQPDVWTGSFEYIPDPGTAPYTVNFLVARMRDPEGTLIGSCFITQLALRPRLIALLARGDQRTYERMARLVTPGRHQAAILFADLQHSGELSRRLPTVRYFELVRELTARFDDAVGANQGVVGKHAGDGWTAFFLVDAATAPEAAVAGAVRTARRLQEAAGALAGGEEGASLCINVGLHWGANLYMGQLVPGGRLDVTALGDEVNECARIQETARDGAILASKSFVELLSPESAEELGVTVARLTYQPLAGLPGVGDKAVRDAGTVAVSRL